MCLNFDIHQDEQEELDKLLIELFQKYKTYCSFENYKGSLVSYQQDFLSQIKKNFIEDIKFKLDTLDLNTEIKGG